MFGRLLVAAGGDRLVRDGVNARLGSPLRILSGHRVIDESTGLSDDDAIALRQGCLSLSSCRERLDYLRRSYEILSLDHVVKILQGGKGLPPNAIVMTFDDGYCDIYASLYPLMKVRRIPFTVFLTSGWIGRPGKLTEEQVRKMAGDRDAGITWGAHGVSHKDLSVLSPAEAEAEIVESKRTVEQLVGRAVKCFCYPDGKHNEMTESLLRKHGFAAACATGRRLNAPPIDLFALQRIPFEKEPLWRFALRVAGRV